MPAVTLPDTPRNDPRVGYIGVHTLRRHFVPESNIMQHQGQDFQHPARHSLTPDVVVVVPGEAHRSVAVASVERICFSDNSLGEAAAATQHHVIPRQVELLYSQRIERQVMLVEHRGTWKSLHE